MSELWLSSELLPESWLSPEPLVLLEWWSSDSVGSEPLDAELVEEPPLPPELDVELPSFPSSEAALVSPPAGVSRAPLSPPAALLV